jgi:hypothetical protein
MFDEFVAQFPRIGFIPMADGEGLSIQVSNQIVILIRPICAFGGIDL